MSIGLNIDVVDNARGHVLGKAKALLETALRNRLTMGLIFGVNWEEFDRCVAIMKAEIDAVDAAEFAFLTMTKSSELLVHEYYEIGLREYLGIKEEDNVIKGGFDI